MKENGTYGSHFKIKKTLQNKRKKRNCPRKREMERERLIFFFFFLSLFSSIYGNLTIGIRRGKKQSALLNEGYAWEPKTWDFAEFSIKNSENPMFWFFSDLLLSDGQIWSEHEAKLIHASRATREYQNFGVLSNSMRYGFSYKYVNYTYTNSK